MLINVTLSLAGLIMFIAAQNVPLSWIDVNPRPEHEVFLQIDGSVTSYIGPADYLTTITRTGTLSGTLATATASLEFAAVTATVASEDDSVGDVSIVVAPKLKSMWLDLADKHCGGRAKRLVRKDFASCAMSYVTDVVSNSQSLNIPGSAAIPKVKSAGIAEILEAAFAAGTVTVETQPYAVLSLVALTIWFESGQLDMPHAIKIPAAEVEAPAASATNPECPPRETGKPSEVICQNLEDCNGDKNDVCQAGKYKGCPCAVALEFISHNDLLDLDAQQSILAAWANSRELFSNSPLATPSGTPRCIGSVFGMDPKVAQNLANLFCSTADFTNHSAQILGGSDLSPAVTIDKGLKALFLFWKYPAGYPNVCDGTPEGCRQMYATIINTCQFNSHNVYGLGAKAGECGSWSISIAPDDFCAAPKANGNKQCNTRCSPLAGTCESNPGGPGLSCKCIQPTK